MTIIHAKSKAILVCKGKGSEVVKRRFIRRTKQGRVLRFAHAQEIVDIPLVDSFVYLGAVASYGLFEDQTLEHRLQTGRANFWRLHRVLHGKYALSRSNRVNIWRTWSPHSQHLWAHGMRPHEQGCTKTHPRNYEAGAACGG